MSKESIINHFSDVGLVYRLDKACKVLFTPYTALFKERGLEFNFELEGAEKTAHLDRIRDILLSLSTDTEAGRRLANVLDEIVLVDKNYSKVSTYIEDITQKWGDGLRASGYNIGEQLELVAALCTDERKEVSDAMAIIVSRIHSLDSATNRDYHWFGDFAEEKEDGSVKLPVFKVPDDKDLAAKKEDLEAQLNAGFEKNHYTTDCHVVLQPKSADGEIWALVEHSGRIVVREKMEDGKASTIKYPPLTRSIVVLDTERRMLRIKSGAEWMYNLLSKKFSNFFCGHEELFQQGQMYWFDPITRHGLAKAFSIADYSTIINKAYIVSIKCDVMDGAEGDQLTLNNTKDRDICATWEKFSKDHILWIRSITLRLRIKGCKNRVTVKIDKEKGLFVSMLSKMGLVRSWLRRRGFEKHYPIKEYCSKESKAAVPAAFWPIVRTLLETGEVSKANLYNVFDSLAPGVGDFVNPRILKEVASPKYEKKWTDAYGREWDVKYNEATDSYYGSNINVELGIEAGPDIDPSEVEIQPINKDALLKDIQTALMKNSRLNMDDMGDGVHRLGQLNALGVSAFLATGTNWHPAFKGNNVTNSSIAVVTFTESPPDLYKEQIEESYIQHAWLGKLLRWDIAEKRLVEIAPVESEINENNTLMFQSNDTPPWHRWPLGLPEERYRHLSEVEFILGCDYATIRYAGVEKRFTLDELVMLQPKRPKRNPNKVKDHPNFATLLRFIRANERSGDMGFELKETGSSGSRKNLNDDIGLFFGTNDCVWEEIPEYPGRYRLAFASCTTTVDDD